MYVWWWWFGFLSSKCGNSMKIEAMGKGWSSAFGTSYMPMAIHSFLYAWIFTLRFHIEEQQNKRGNYFVRMCHYIFQIWELITKPNYYLLTGQKSTRVAEKMTHQADYHHSNRLIHTTSSSKITTICVIIHIMSMNAAWKLSLSETDAR